MHSTTILPFLLATGALAMPKAQPAAEAVPALRPNIDVHEAFNATEVKRALDSTRTCAYIEHWENGKRFMETVYADGNCWSYGFPIGTSHVYAGCRCSYYLNGKANNYCQNSREDTAFIMTGDEQHDFGDVGYDQVWCTLS